MKLIFCGFSCNNACVFCAQGNLRASQPDSTTQAVSAAIQAALRPKTDDLTLAFIGGEPTLCDKLPSWISEAKRRGAKRIILQTNGRRLAYAHYAKRLAGAGLCSLDISLHGSSAAMHDYHTRAPGSWLQTLAGMKNARALGVPMGVTVVVTRSNFRNLSEIATLAAAQGAKAVYFAPARSLGTAAELYSRVVAHEEMVEPYLSSAVERAKALGLGVVSPSGPDPDCAQGYFAGIGQTQTREIQTLYPQERREGRPSKAKPGLAEIHRRDKKTGEDLRSLFPKLFDRESEKAA